MSPHPSGSLMGLGVIDPALEARLGMGMARVEDFLRASVRSEYPFVTEASRHLVDAGGKRFRPLLVLLAAEFGDPEAPGVVPAAVVSGFDMTELTFGGGRDITAKVLVVVSKSHTSQLEVLDEMLDESGSGSVVAAINDRLDADDIGFWVTSIGDYGEFAWGGVDYYGALVMVRVLT